MHLTELYEPDPRERIYVPWREDPRPFSGALQGVYAFSGSLPSGECWPAPTRARNEPRSSSPSGAGRAGTRCGHCARMPP
ncbi:MAG TPA: HEXXH motif-containing putative peptide modification protein [Pseudonocardiaceae bacterium]|nr:HEXXH motif-containing putative peptide modification protein [Pseudonocardiaceae bacterium]